MHKRLAIGLLAAIVVVGLVVARRHELLRFTIERGASLGSGYAVRVDRMHVGWSAAAFWGVRMRRDGLPVLDADYVALHYSLRDLLPGSTHRFGLLGAELSGARVTLTRFRDGTFNLSLPQSGPAVPLPERTNPVPLHFSLRVRGLQLELREPAAFEESAKTVRVRDVSADGVVNTAGVTTYRVDGAFAARRPEPFAIRGKIDAIAGYAMHRARAPFFPLRALSNYFADTPVVRVLKGAARNFDARVYALDVEPDVAPQYHVSLRLDVEGARIAIEPLAQPVDGIHGRLEVIDNAFFVRGVRATLAGMPMRIDGGVYDFSGALTGKAQLRLGISAAGDLAIFRNAFAFTKDQPIAGRTSLGVLVEGPIDDPLIVAKANAPRARYRTLPFDALDANVIYHSGLIAFAPLGASYGGVAVRIRGSLTLGKHLRSQLALHVAAPAGRLPYLDEMLGQEPIVVDAAALGSDLLFHVVGTAASERDESRLAALFEMDPNGTASVSPFWFHTERGDFDGGYLLDRPENTSAFWISSRGLRMSVPRLPAFPGLALPEMPPIAGRAVAMTLAGGGSGPHVVVAGSASVAQTSIAGIEFDTLAAEFAGTLNGAAINRMNASGPWGSFAGSGDFSTQRFVAYGKYRGTFEGLQPFLGKAIPGHGALAGTVAVAVEPRRILVQGTNLMMHGATLHGIPLSEASLTLAVEGDTLRLYDAHARVAGGDVVAAGTFSTAPHPSAGSGGSLSIVTGRLSARQLAGIGLPLEDGALWATGNLSAGSPFPRFAGGVTIGNGRAAGFAMSGSGDVLLDSDAVALRGVIGSLGEAYADVDGRIERLSSTAPQYALKAYVPAAGVAGALRSFKLPNYLADGTFNAHLDVTGRTTSPQVSGRVAVPAGAVNGLPFVDASGTIAADQSGVSVRDGAVLVGTTYARFGATARPRDLSVDVRAQHADLSDFNNFFDTGDTLDGNGRVQIDAGLHGDAFDSSGDVDVRGFRYRNLPIGDTRAQWSSERNVLGGSLSVGGAQGLLGASGSIGLARRDSWQATLENSQFNLNADVKDLDLSLWMPALGMRDVPITGRASGEATVRGRFPRMDLRADARVTSGTLGPLTLERADLALHAARERIVIDRAELATPELAASAAGSMGLAPDAALDVRVHAATDDLAGLTYRIAHVKVPVSGSFESTVSIGGTYRSPAFVAGFDGTDVRAYGIPIAALFGEVRLRGRSLVLSDAGATFTRGQATLAGSLPLQLSPLRLASPSEPLSLDVDVADLDPAIFDAMLGSNTKLGGDIHGHLGLSGTIRQPQILGHVALENGSYVSDLERVPIQRVAASLAFNRTSASVARASAQLGAGTLQGSGSMDFANGFAARGASLSAVASASNAQLDLPAYGNGSVDAKLSLTKKPGGIALLSGNATLNNAILPFAGFLKAAQPGEQTGPPPPLAFDLQAAAGKNVRVRGSGYGAGLDIGASGSVSVGGTFAAPTLDGKINSTGGTLTYFDRAFRVKEGAVTFNAADGLAPNLHAVASASVVNPDPDRARNPYGSAEISITVDGPIAGLKIGLTSIPAGYSRSELLGLIAPFGGFVGGIGFNRQSMLAQQQPGGVTPLGALSPIPNVSVSQNSTITVGQEAFNILNAQFAAGLLAPVESTIGQGLGLSSVNLTLGYYGNVGFSATRLLGKAVSAVYAVTFGIPQIQSFGLQVQAGTDTTATLNFYYQTGPTKLVQLPNSVGYGAGYLIGQPLVGNSGFSLTAQHYFW